MERLVRISIPLSADPAVSINRSSITRAIEPKVARLFSPLRHSLGFNGSLRDDRLFTLLNVFSDELL